MIKSNNGGTTNHETLNDLDSEEAALHEFDFLTGEAANSANINQMKSNGLSIDCWIRQTIFSII